MTAPLASKSRHRGANRGAARTVTPAATVSYKVMWQHIGLPPVSRVGPTISVVTFRDFGGPSPMRPGQGLQLPTGAVHPDLKGQPGAAFLLGRFFQFFELDHIDMKYQ